MEPRVIQTQASCETRTIREGGCPLPGRRCRSFPHISRVALLTLALCLMAGRAWSIDKFYPTFGNNGIDVLHYDLDLHVSLVPHHLAANAKLTILALYRLESFSLDLTGLTVSQASVGGEPAAFLQENDKLILRPRLAIAKGDVFEVAISYAGSPGPILDPNDGTMLGWTNYGKSIYVVSEPIGASTFYPVNDEPSDKATFRIAVTVPPYTSAVANGVLKSTTWVGKKKRFVWEMRQPMTSWLATVHVNRFKVTLDSTPRGLPLRFYTTPETPTEDVQGYALAGTMLTYFETLLGRYPFDGYGSVVVDDPNLFFALENQGMSTFPQGAADEAIVAHELAHQWFGNAVSVAKWRDLWLAEGSATYFEILWTSHNDPADFARKMQNLYDYLVYTKTGPAVVDRPEEMFSDRTYLRGAATLYALQLKVGEQTFFRILRRFLSDYRGANATSLNFIDTAVAVSGDPEVPDLLAGWLYGQDIPPLPGSEPVLLTEPEPVPAPAVVGLRRSRGSHRGAPAE